MGVDQDIGQRDHIEVINDEELRQRRMALFVCLNELVDDTVFDPISYIAGRLRQEDPEVAALFNEVSARRAGRRR